ncbi:ribonuclease T2 [Rhizobium sp. AAP43]|uniref:ribonuclease T2 family protein n=1 Tax=Rhizobium sp. AAP43 TaxID=1523420 RepID=UPI0006B98FCC|nr:ribonuclease T2 [Rhizobium sp. AAP43]KPF41971.1 ribonuclease T2 [Rhizobium sp. AAP43]
MRRYAGFVALGLMMVMALAYSLFPTAPISNSDQTTAAAPRPKSPAPTANTNTSAGNPSSQPSSPTSSSDFDFYVLALSWSPTFCLGEAAGRNREQCGEGKNFGFVVHGLWPQYERGYPESCPTDEGDRVPTSLGRTVMDIMPSMGLIGHQWRKHGSCSGLRMQDYFKLVRQASEIVKVPAQFSRPGVQTRLSPQTVETAFIRSNPGLPRSAVAVTCDRDRIDEVRICLDRSLAFRACQEVDRNSCRRADLTVPPIR